VSFRRHGASNGTYVIADEAARRKDAVNVNADVVQKGEPHSYQGLPARFEIPTGDKRASFNQELLTTDREHAVTIFLVSSSVIWFAGLVLVALAAGAIWRSRHALAAGVRARIAPPVATPEVVA
jgi:hypothetical protein